MPASQDPNLGLYYGWSTGEDGWGDNMNTNLKKLGALIHLAVKDKDLATPPGSPAEGDRYIVGPAASGAWAGHEDDVAVRIGGSWEFYTPFEGVSAWVNDEDSLYTFTGTAWGTSVPAQPYDLHVTFNSRPDSETTLLRVVFPRTTTLPQNLTGSYAKAEIAATASATFALTKNGASIGSINWGIGATSATFTFSTGQTFAAGDVLELTSPAVVDPTLADFAITLVGWR